MIGKWRNQKEIPTPKTDVRKTILTIRYLYTQQNKKRSGVISQFSIKCILELTKFHLYHFKDMLFGQAFHTRFNNGPKLCFKNLPSTRCDTDTDTDTDTEYLFHVVYMKHDI